ncbi:GPR98 protein, partial [Amia calva]|nr:GPR98 protein [Amia calva]
LDGNGKDDFVAASAAVFLLASETNRTVHIGVMDDDFPEADETFVFSLLLQNAGPTVRLGTPNKAIVTILSNDNAFGIISFNTSSLITVNETRNGSQFLPLSLIREKGTYGNVTVNYEIIGGPNPAGEDLTPAKGNITILPGRALMVFNLEIIDDQLPEDDEVFTVQLTSVEGGATINPNHSSIQIRINKNDSPIKFAQSLLLVPETAGIVTVTVTRGRNEEYRLIGSDATEISINYEIFTGNNTGSAMLITDFIDLQPNHIIVFPPRVYEAQLKFEIIDDINPEIAESFQVVLVKESLRGDGVLLSPSMFQVTIEPNDKPFGVLSINSGILTPIIINEDMTLRQNQSFEGISIIRNSGTHGSVSVNWVITRNGTDRAAVTEDLGPAEGTLHFTDGQMSALVPIRIIPDELPEEAEAYLFRLLPLTVQGGATVDEPMEMVFYIQDSNDIYGLFRFNTAENQKIESHPSERFLSLSFLRQNGTLGDVQLNYTALYIPAGPVEPVRARDGVLNSTHRNSLVFLSGQSQARVTLPIRNDAFLQNGAHFVIQLDSVELVSISPPIPPVSPRLGGDLNILLIITHDIANGEISFSSNQTLVVLEPEDTNSNLISLPLWRDGTDGQADVFWSIRPTGFNQRDVTPDDLGPFNGSVTFLSGQNMSSINITVRADSVPEINETLVVTLDRTDVENQILKPGFTSREIVIMENDDPGGVFEFSPRSRGPWDMNEGDAVELRVVRNQGLLLKQLIRYEVRPPGTSEFYGATGILEFMPGEREVVVALVAQPDGIPELDEVYSVVLSSHSTPPSRLGAVREVNITIRKNDDPFGVIEFLHAGLLESVNESKGADTHSATYTIVRKRGTFGEVSVSWSLAPAVTRDVFPVQGTLIFAEADVSKTLTIFSLPDELPEDVENFTITLLNVTGGARLGEALKATLQIRKNDDPIYFADPVAVRLREGDVANFSVLRNGSADFVATVMYQIAGGDASAGDFISEDSGNILIFEIGEWMKNMSVAVVDDNIPETDENFYIILYNATGDAVVHGADMATVVIEANDDANGIFSLETTEKAVEEGHSNYFYIKRDRGLFGTVEVYWQLFGNDTALEPGQEFTNTSGAVIFKTGEQAKPITLQAMSDGVPEFNEVYDLRLINISGGDPGQGGRLAEVNLNVSVFIPPNDDPFGVFVIDPRTLDQEVAEDILTEEDMSDVASFTVLRQQGTFGIVRVGWEILSDAFPLGLPPMKDLILMASFPTAVELRPHMRRHHSGTDALYFSGALGAFGIIRPEDQLAMNETMANFTFSAWLIPQPDTNGFIVAKGNDNGTLYYGIKVHTNQSHVTLLLYHTPVGSSVTQVAKVTAERFLEENSWLHIIITLDDGIIQFYLDGTPIPGGIKSLKGEAIADGAGQLNVGAAPGGEDRYMGLLQDVRLYTGRLNHAQIHELHTQPAKADLRNISGYLEYQQGETQKSFIVEVRDDKEEEGEEVFTLRLVSTHGGARLPEPNPTARLRVQKSDNANGLFGFTGACIPDSSEEGSTVSCVVERTRGALDHVYVNYTVTQIESSSDAPDFANSSGAIMFLPWHRSEVLNLLVLDDDIPEFAEKFRVTLVSAESGDRKPGSTPTSGASIDPDAAATTVTIRASDHPNGLLQFSAGAPPGPDDRMVRPAVAVPSIAVREEQGEVRLLVVRAQGLLERVMVGYRTVPLTAVSPDHFEETVGVLDFMPGERYKYISVNITDNSVPELEKTFRVELYNPEGGVDELFRSEGSGSGEGDAEFFLPSLHQCASLGIASNVTVTIAASDDAHGVFQFSSDSLSVNGTEPEEGRSSVLLQVVRNAGALSRVTVFWEVELSSEGDLVSRTGNITFEVGQTRGNITVQVLSDNIPELDKNFSIVLSNVSHGRLGNLTQAMLTVLANNDPYGLFVFSNESRSMLVREANREVTLKIERQMGLMGTVQVTYGTLKDNEALAVFPAEGFAKATEGSDYIALLTSVIFAANQSEANITLQVLDDQDAERAESVFVQLLSVHLVKGLQGRPIPLSPRLGPQNSTVAQVIIDASDDAFGVLRLSAPAVSVAESYIGPIVNVTRTGGIFADVSVKFRAVPMTARVGEDFSVASSDVVLLEGETSKPVPIYIINDNRPELEEMFRIELLNQTTGGALLGDLTQTIITILPSDDPFGSFVFQAAPITVEEPAVNSTQINLPIVRNAGTVGNVTLQWAATVNGKPAIGDLQPVSGQLIFVLGETMKILTVDVLADDVAEIEEVILVALTEASNGGSIGSERVVNIVVPPNDNPHGTVFFRQSMYRVQEPLEGVFTANITISRRGGRFGHLQILYSTEEIDIVTQVLDEGQNIFSYYDPPVQAMPTSPFPKQFNVSSHKDPLLGCATFCLQEQACLAFSFSNSSGSPSCDWAASAGGGRTSSSRFLTFTKNVTAASSLFSFQAVAGSDYEPVTGKVATMMDGQDTTNLTVSILTDSLPEVDEKFSIHLLRVDLLNASATPQNQPTIAQPSRAVVTIAMNGDAFGVFLIYSTSPNATKSGAYLEVQEEARSSVLLVIERRGGSLGQVTVEWRVVGGTATPGADFNGTGEILTFKEGKSLRVHCDLRKTIELSIIDDAEPEDNESIVVMLTSTEGGSRILPSSDSVTIVILANDYVAGVVGFHTASRSVIAREGESLALLVMRTPPGFGNVTVNWRIEGPRVSQNFANTSGVLFFTEGSLNETIAVQLLDDGVPEEKEEYRVILSDISTRGVPTTGIAVLDRQGSEAMLTAEASDEPYGVLTFAPYSKLLSTPEGNTTIHIFINREFGSLGAINVSYETVRGALQDPALREGALAEPGLDFLPQSGSVLLREGQTSVAIPITILDDDVPELQEFFLVNITSAVLMTYFPTAPKFDIQGLVAQVTIDGNDGIRGIIEWQSTSYEVNETIGILTLVVYRNGGTYGNVSVFFYAQNLEAHLGVDFNATSSILYFANGERHKFVEVLIFNDDLPEGDEKFQLILVNPSFGLELGDNTTATVTILANDDGHGIISFNNSQHFLLREPSSMSAPSESVATLYIVRDPPQGTFGTVTAQFHITPLNGSNATEDLVPTQGFIVLEDGVRVKTLQISAVLDEEPEINETFAITLSNPSGGARLGESLQTLITVLQNQAPLGLFRIFPLQNRINSVTVEEGNSTLYFRVSRSNGLEMAVSVEWETESHTAYGMKGDVPVLSVFQTFPGEASSAWCILPSQGGDPLALRVGRGLGSTLYRWQGVFVPLQTLDIPDAKHCITFIMNGSSYVAVTHGGQGEARASNSSLFKLGPDLNLTLEQSIPVESGDIKYFSVENKNYLIILNQVNVHTIKKTCLTWADGQFRTPQPLDSEGLAKQVETFRMGADVYLLLVTEGNNSTCKVFVWRSQQPFFQLSQSIDFSGLNSVHSFTPPSGITHLLLAGRNKSVLYSWRSELSVFSPVLETQPAHQLLSLTALDLNSTRSLIVATGDSDSTVYELTFVSNQSDFIPSSGELRFEAGDGELVIAVNVIDDNTPEEEESFRVRLKNPRGGAEIGLNGYVTVVIPSNDDAHGIIAFEQNSVRKEVDEQEQDSLITLNVERLRGTFGKITVHWTANGSLSDIVPTSGVVTFSGSQALATISLRVLADSVPELAESVTVTLTGVTTIGVQEAFRGAVIDPNRNQAHITILPSDSPYGVISWRPDSLFISTQEPEQNQSNVTLSIVREQGFVGDVAVHFTTKPALSQLPMNQATENKDYVAKEEMVIIKENMTVVQVYITILPDDIPELAETFLVNITRVELLGGLGGAGLPSVKRLWKEIVEITILENDDPRGVVQFNISKDMTGRVLAYEVFPPGNILQLPVVRLSGLTGRVVVHWEARPIIASLEDFAPPAGNITFSDGQAVSFIEITIIDDNIVEFMETFSVALTQVAGGARLGNDSNVTVIIPPNDSPVGLFGFELQMVTVREPQFSDDPAAMANLTVVRSPVGRGSVLIVWLVEETAANDLASLNGTLHFNETESRKVIVVRALADAVLEGDEKFSIKLLSATNDPVISPINDMATIIIQGDQGAFGTVGIAATSQNILIGEPKGGYNGTALVSIVRGPGIFGEIMVYWNITPAIKTEFEETSGLLVMRDQQSAATIRLQALDDDIPEERRVFRLFLSGVSEGAEVSQTSGQATITMVASDLPHGRFSFAQELLQASEKEGKVTVTVVRSRGSFGSVQLWYQTSSGTAKNVSDFRALSGQLVFGSGVAVQNISVDILDDDLPEGPEEFYLNITRVELLNASGSNFTLLDYGLQLDEPPVIGNSSSAIIVIQKNDNAEGIIEFDPQYINVTVEEDAGTVVIPVLRRGGLFGQVTADFASRSVTALPNGIDYSLANTSVTFEDGQNRSYINVSITDDTDSEYEELFEIQLTGATGGAVLGIHLFARITIAKSDSPNGLIRFLNQSTLTIPNPNSTQILTLVLERTGGLIGASMIKWNILGPNSKEVLPALNTDIGEPVNGSFHFRDGEGGIRTIALKVLPHGEVEVQEAFTVTLSLLSGDTDIDSQTNTVTLTIEKFGDPNGIVQFTQQDRERTYFEPSTEGPLNISFLITRLQGVMGNITVWWELFSDSDMTGDFSFLRGAVLIPDGQRSAEVTVRLLPDDVPELDEEFLLRLTSVEGGAELDANRSTSRFKVLANDEPHGVFALYSGLQSMAVGEGLNRLIVLNVTRHAGTFGNVTVEYNITLDGPGQDSFMDTMHGNLLVKDGASFGSSTVPISSQVFLAVGFNFTIRLSYVTLIGPAFSTLPQLMQGAQMAVASVPEAAANSEVGFASVALQISNFTTGSTQAVISRTGLYGAVSVDWMAGYPPSQAPAGFQLGHVTPSSGTVTLANGERSRAVALTALSNSSDPAALALHLRAVHSDAPGGARLSPRLTVAEVEPLGVFQFAPSSRQLKIDEDVQVITLYVQRLFGFRSNQTRLTYQMSPGSAKPQEDFVDVYNGDFVFESNQTSVAIQLSIVNDNIPETDESFYVILTSAEVLNSIPPAPGLKPRLIPEFSVASVTILANDAINGFLSIGPAFVRAQEDSENATQQTVLLRVRRTVGDTGVVQATVKTFGGRSFVEGLQGTQFEEDRVKLNLTWAMEGEDFLPESVVVTLQEGQQEAEVLVKVLDDKDPEGQEVFFVYLTNPLGGAQIVDGPDDRGFLSFAKIIILGSDLQNGIVGFTLESQTNMVLDEDSQNRTAMLILQRQENRSFEDVTVFWKATFNQSSFSLVNNGVNLTKELLSTSGTALCRRGEVLCFFTVEIRPDNVPEIESWFLVEIYEVGAGAKINGSARFAKVTILESDSPHALIFFKLGSRVPAALPKTKLLTLQVAREGIIDLAVSVHYSMQELKETELVGDISIWPAVAGMDFKRSEGMLTFEVGKSIVALDISLTPEQASSNPLPKRFQVLLSNPTVGDKVHPEFSIANITIVSDPKAQAMWDLLEQLHQPLDQNILDWVLQNLLNKVASNVTAEQLSFVNEALGKVVAEGDQSSLANSSKDLTYELLCTLANPSRQDTRGVSQLSEITERFAFSLLKDTECDAEGKRGTILDTCPYIKIEAYHWYPQQINGHIFEGKNGDSIQIPEALLEVPPSDRVPVASCEKVQFTEYSSQQCWLSDSQFCRVVDDTTNFVSCACSHLSIYTAYAQVDALSSYNEAFFTASFICISGFTLAILSHVLCSRFSMFAAKLLTHMMVACLGTQITFLVSASRSRQLSEESCSALGLFSHYLHLSQFSWMLIQAVNFWQVLVMNNEHTERRYLLYLLLSWGLPALVIALLVIILLGAHSWSIHSVYGLVNGDVCFIPNVYAALCTAVLVPLVCLVGVFVVFFHVYQVTQQWKSYDDVFRGRTNSTEVPLVLYLFALISLVWLWGGLHMAYKQLWMLVLFVIFNCLLGLYVFVVYFIMHNQFCWPVKSSYTVEMNGHSSPGSAFQGSGTPTVGGEISKSTQNLISAMEEVPADWERASLRPSSQASSVFKQSPQNGNALNTQGAFINTSLVADEESQEFDDLIFALKTGSGLNISDNESCHGSQDGVSVANSQIVELRRIPIADTHL